MAYSDLPIGTVITDLTPYFEGYQPSEVAAAIAAMPADSQKRVREDAEIMRPLGADALRRVIGTSVEMAAAVLDFCEAEQAAQA